MKLICGIYSLLGWFGKFIPQLLFRVLVAWHFWDSGLAKFNQSITITPEQKIALLSVAGYELSFKFVMWLELTAAVLVFVGFGTRIVATIMLALIVSVFMSYLPLDFTTLFGLWHEIDAQIPAFKYQLALLLILISLILSGSGGFSFDGLFRIASCPNKHRAYRAEKDALDAKEKANVRAKEFEAKSTKLESQLAKVEKKLEDALSNAGTTSSV